MFEMLVGCIVAMILGVLLIKVAEVAPDPLDVCCVVIGTLLGLAALCALLLTIAGAFLMIPVWLVQGGF